MMELADMRDLGSRADALGFESPYPHQKETSLFPRLVFFVYENPALGAGGSETPWAMGQDKKTPFDVE